MISSCEMSKRAPFIQLLLLLTGALAGVYGAAQVLSACTGGDPVVGGTNCASQGIIEHFNTVYTFLVSPDNVDVRVTLRLSPSDIASIVAFYVSAPNGTVLSGLTSQPSYLGDFTAGVAPVLFLSAN